MKKFLENKKIFLSLTHKLGLGIYFPKTRANVDCFPHLNYVIQNQYCQLPQQNKYFPAQQKVDHFQNQKNYPQLHFKELYYNQNYDDKTECDEGRDNSDRNDYQANPQKKFPSKFTT